MYFWQFSLPGTVQGRGSTRAQIFEFNDTPLHFSSMYVYTFRHEGACLTYCLLRILSACHRKTRRPAPQIFGQNPKISTYVPACVVSRLPSIQCLISNSTTFCHSSTNFGPASNTTMRTTGIIQFCSLLTVLHTSTLVTALGMLTLVVPRD
jgi:hypothetical protein